MSDLPKELENILCKINKEIRLGKSVLICGPPGCGKTMVARRVSRLAHDFESKYQEVSAIHRMNGLNHNNSIPQPFRAPHHTVSVEGLIGNGKRFRPGELSLAHGGVLFLDEVDEFSTKCLEVVAHAFENKCVEYGLSSQWLRGLPSDFSLIGAINITINLKDVIDGSSDLQLINSQVLSIKKILNIIPFDVIINLPKLK